MLRTRPKLLLALGMILTGCQQPTTVSSLPTPSFTPPAITPPPPPVAAAPPRAWSPAPRVPVAGSTPSDWAPRARAHRWKYIVIHHSATPDGSAAKFDASHRAKGWDELGYHFVIGNGTLSANGSVEVGPRWPKQKYGAHTKTADDRYNNDGIGICLVGNFDLTRPTDAQLRSLAKLVAHLQKTYRISSDRVLGHGDCRPTACPGRHMSVARVRQMAQQMLAAGDVPLPADAQLASGELLTSDAH